MKLYILLLSICYRVLIVEGDNTDFVEVDRCTTIVVGELAGSEG